MEIHKSVDPDFSGHILKMVWEAMISYLAHLLDITINNIPIPSDWKRSHSGSCLQKGQSLAGLKL
jgi:hypothetical protein